MEKNESGYCLISLLFLETTVPDTLNPKQFFHYYLSFLKIMANIIRYMLIIPNLVKKCVIFQNMSQNTPP